MTDAREHARVHENEGEDVDAADDEVDDDWGANGEERMTVRTSMMTNHGDNAECAFDAC